MNNTNLDFPAIMNDGRALTDYRSSCIQNINSIELDSLTYRNRLQANGQDIIDETNRRLEEYVKCTDCPDYSIIEPSIIQSCNSNKCTFTQLSSYGLGVVNDY